MPSVTQESLIIHQAERQWDTFFHVPFDKGHDKAIAAIGIKSKAKSGPAKN